MVVCLVVVVLVLVSSPNGIFVGEEFQFHLVESQYVAERIRVPRKVPLLECPTSLVVVHVGVW